MAAPKAGKPKQRLRDDRQQARNDVLLLLVVVPVVVMVCVCVCVCVKNGCWVFSLCEGSSFGYTTLAHHQQSLIITTVEHTN